MKNLFSKIIATLVLLFIVFGIAELSYAAFPGKHNQTKQVTTEQSSELVSANTNQSKSATPIDEDQILLIILAFLIPPLAVYLKYDEAGKPFIINVILTLLCGVPGIIHALVHVLRK